MKRRRRSAAEMRLTEEQRQLAGHWYPALRRRLVPVAMRAGLDRGEAESVVSYAVVLAAGGWSPTAPFDRYCYSVVRRHARNARRDRPRPLASLDAPGNADSDTTWADSIPAPPIDDDPPPPLLEALEAIPPADLALLWARYADGDTASAIARRMGWHTTLAEGRIACALKRARLCSAM